MLDKGLSHTARTVLFWFTMVMIVVVAFVAILYIVRSCRNVMSLAEPQVTISPSQVDLCPGEQHPFAINSDAEVTWESTGGFINQAGLFTASEVPGEYTVMVFGPDGRQAAAATVQVIACAPTTTPAPTAAPTPTQAPTEEAAAVATDAQGDVGIYDSGAPVEGYPPGVDLSGASVAADLSVALEPTGELPADLSDWVTEGDMVLWITFHTAIPDPPPVYMNWLFSLDVDANTATGRPAGSRQINPDLGDEAVIGLTYNNATAAYEPYFLVWDPNQANWATGAGEVRWRINQARTILGLALPRETFIQSVEQTSGVTVAPDGIKGRAAADSYAGEQRVIDFYPELP